MRIESGFALTLAVGIASAACARRPVTPAAAVAPVAAVSAARVAEPVPEPAPVPEPVVVAAAPSDPFQSEVKPLLMRKCSPCHAPGGQMYARMPFDDPATVREHQAGIVGRLKAEAAVIERWLAAAR